MSYTTKQRNEIYKKTLDRLPESKKCSNGDVHRTKRRSMCRAFCYALKGKPELCGMEQMEEIKLFKPSHHRTYWLPKDDLQTRQIILDFCILMTEN